MSTSDQEVLITVTSPEVPEILPQAREAFDAAMAETRPPAPAADNPAGTQEALADLIHDIQCTRNRPCGYGLPGHGHNAYYRERADAVYSKLEPEIGGANVLLATRVILEELAP